ncbi:MAG: DUF975 family protein [Candidatus Aminicenantes bacterium]|nr:DUF975 family protein [Candidatus Aminicenantes bacterium]
MNNKNEKASAAVLVPEPYAGLAYSFGWDRMKKFFLDLFLITLIVGVVWIPYFMILSLDGAGTPGGVILQLFAFAYLLLLWPPFDYGSAFVFLKAVRSEPFEVKDMFIAFENYTNVVLASLLHWAIVSIGFFLLVVPGIIFACKLAFVKYLVIDKKLDPVEAVKESWRMTKGHAGKIFLMGLLAFPIVIAGMICFGIGVIPAVMWIRCAFASMYYAVNEAEEEKTKIEEK